MPSIDLGPWLPDQPEIGAPPHLREAINLIPRAQGFGPFNGLAESTDALDERARGLYGIRDRNQSGRLFAGDSEKLYQLSAAVWTDWSKSGGYGPATDSTRWRFFAYGDRMLAVNGIDPVQYLDMTSGDPSFEDLAGSPGAPEYVVSYLDFVFIAGGSLGGAVLKWSDALDSEEWTPGIGMSDEQELTDGGRITGLVVTRAALYVLQEHCIRRVLFVGGDVIMRIDKIVEGVGCIEPNSVAAWGQDIFFLAESGFCRFDGVNAPSLIGAEQVDNWFASDSRRLDWVTMSAAIDPTRKLVGWAYASTASGQGLPDTLLVFNYAVNRWGMGRVDTEVIATAMSLAVSPDDLTDYVPDDHPEIGPDDPFWQGGVLYFAAMSRDHKLASFAGSALQALAETSFQSIYDGRRASPQWIKPVTDSVQAMCAAGAKVRPGDSPTWTTASAQEVSGRCWQRGANGFYHALRVVIPAGDDSWTYVRAAEFQPGLAKGVR